MLEALFTSVIATEGIAVSSFLTCLAGSLVLGALLAFVFTYRSKTNYTKSFVGTLLILPAVVAIVIMMVSGSIGTGIAVAGTFSLVRFRSIPGTAREIGAIFLAMAVGLACGMGYLGFAAIFAVVMGIVTLIYNLTSLGEHSADSLDKVLRITVPEDLEYGAAFGDVFSRYTTQANLIGVKTTNLGSLNRLTYSVRLKEAGTEKALIDDLRVRNGNLEINMMVRGAEEGETL
ncbi:MAG: DUF4956 domain-containing protein [Acutalibacteraceae bacterium]|nr:DUF4956 domain-containing protein [Clostridia bacterium]MBQ5580763.1 DUF4956 domain-containing protein [Clostridia bacterium]MEE1292833.1 DUF4956 domain-containing protein [Acutalibacteraceae bacterium]MEE3373913.1 DUF4956 domain-containing protein [Acutalibacteraceae bacterium]NLD30330.1 DUF4956 domain-containing protein [Clostridiales bacterium]